MAGYRHDPFRSDEHLRLAVSVVIRSLREERGRRQSDVARDAGISAGYLSQIENGVRRPSWETLTGIAHALDTTPEALIADARARREGLRRGLTGLQDPRGVMGMLTSPLGAAAQAAARPRHFHDALRRAQQVVEDDTSLRSLSFRAADAARQALQDHGSLALEVLALARLCAAHADGFYRAAPREVLDLITAGLIYLVEPQDIIPDYIDDGYVDDAAVLAFVASLAGKSVDDFLAWENTLVANLDRPPSER